MNKKRKKKESLEKPTKQTEGKLFYEIDWEFVEGIAERMALNKKNGKYDVFGWRKNLVDTDEMNQALVRHLIEILKGSYSDEQKYGHYYALAANAMLIINSLKQAEPVSLVRNRK